MPAPRNRRSWRTYLIGRRLPTSDAAHEAIGKRIGLAVFASDPLSSTAYATQEMLTILAVAGVAGFAYAFPLAVTIAALLAIVTLSYRQIIYAYPGGGGAYTVARDNLGQRPARRSRPRRCWSTTCSRWRSRCRRASPIWPRHFPCSSSTASPPPSPSWSWSW